MDSDVTQTSANVLTSTVGSVISSADERNESAPAVDSVPSSSSDANSVDVSARKKSTDDPISSTSDVADKQYTKTSSGMGDSKLVLGKTELDNEVDLFANECNLSHLPNEKMEDIVSDLENLLGNPTDHFSVPVCSKKQNDMSELVDNFFDVDKLDEKKTDTHVSISNRTSNVVDKSVLCESNVSVEDLKSESQIILKDEAVAPDTNKQDSDEISTECVNKEQSNPANPLEPDVPSVPPLNTNKLNSPENNLKQVVDSSLESVTNSNIEGSSINQTPEKSDDKAKTSDTTDCARKSSSTIEESTNKKTDAGVEDSDKKVQEPIKSTTPLKDDTTKEHSVVISESDSIPVDNIKESKSKSLEEEAPLEIPQEVKSVDEGINILQSNEESNSTPVETKEIVKAELKTDLKPESLEKEVITPKHDILPILTEKISDSTEKVATAAVKDESEVLIECVGETTAKEISTSSDMSSEITSVVSPETQIKSTSEVETQENKQTSMLDTSEAASKDTLQTAINIASEEPTEKLLQTPITNTSETTMGKTLQTPISASVEMANEVNLQKAIAHSSKAAIDKDSLPLPTSDLTKANDDSRPLEDTSKEATSENTLQKAIKDTSEAENENISKPETSAATADTPGRDDKDISGTTDHISQSMIKDSSHTKTENVSETPTEDDSQAVTGNIKKTEITEDNSQMAIKDTSGASTSYTECITEDKSQADTDKKIDITKAAAAEDTSEQAFKDNPEATAENTSESVTEDKSLAVTDDIKTTSEATAETTSQRAIKDTSDVANINNSDSVTDDNSQGVAENINKSEEVTPDTSQTPLQHTSEAASENTLHSVLEDINKIEAATKDTSPSALKDTSEESKAESACNLQTVSEDNSQVATEDIQRTERDNPDHSQIVTENVQKMDCEPIETVNKDHSKSPDHTDVSEINELEDVNVDIDTSSAKVVSEDTSEKIPTVESSVESNTKDADSLDKTDAIEPDTQDSSTLKVIKPDEEVKITKREITDVEEGSSKLEDIKSEDNVNLAATEVSEEFVCIEKAEKVEIVCSNDEPETSITSNIEIDKNEAETLSVIDTNIKDDPKKVDEESSCDKPENIVDMEKDSLTIDPEVMKPEESVNESCDIAEEANAAKEDDSLKKVVNSPNDNECRDPNLLDLEETKEVSSDTLKESEKSLETDITCVVRQTESSDVSTKILTASNDESSECLEPMETIEEEREGFELSKPVSKGENAVGSGDKNSTNELIEDVPKPKDDDIVEINKSIEEVKDVSSEEKNIKMGSGNMEVEDPKTLSLPQTDNSLTSETSLDEDKPLEINVDQKLDPLVESKKDDRHSTRLEESLSSTSAEGEKSEEAFKEKEVIKSVGGAKSIIGEMLVSDSEKMVEDVDKITTIEDTEECKSTVKCTEIKEPLEIISMVGTEDVPTSENTTKDLEETVSQSIEDTNSQKNSVESSTTEEKSATKLELGTECIPSESKETVSDPQVDQIKHIERVIEVQESVLEEKTSDVGDLSEKITDDAESSKENVTDTPKSQLIDEEIKDKSMENETEPLIASGNSENNEEVTPESIINLNKEELEVKTVVPSSEKMKSEALPEKEESTQSNSNQKNETESIEYSSSKLDPSLHIDANEIDTTQANPENVIMEVDSSKHQTAQIEEPKAKCEKVLSMLENEIEISPNLEQEAIVNPTECIAMPNVSETTMEVESPEEVAEDTTNKDLTKLSGVGESADEDETKVQSLELEKEVVEDSRKDDANESKELNEAKVELPELGKEFVVDTTKNDEKESTQVDEIERESPDLKKENACDVKELSKDNITSPDATPELTDDAVSVEKDSSNEEKTKLDSTTVDEKVVEVVPQEQQCKTEDVLEPVVVVSTPIDEVKEIKGDAMESDVEMSKGAEPQEQLLSPEKSHNVLEQEKKIVDETITKNEIMPTLKEDTNLLLGKTTDNDDNMQTQKETVKDVETKSKIEDNQSISDLVIKTNSVSSDEKQELPASVNTDPGPQIENPDEIKAAEENNPEPIQETSSEKLVIQIEDEKKEQPMEETTLDSSKETAQEKSSIEKKEKVVLTEDLESSVETTVEDSSMDDNNMNAVSMETEEDTKLISEDTIIKEKMVSAELDEIKMKTDEENKIECIQQVSELDERKVKTDEENKTLTEYLESFASVTDSSDKAVEIPDKSVPENIGSPVKLVDKDEEKEETEKSTEKIESDAEPSGDMEALVVETKDIKEASSQNLEIAQEIESKAGPSREIETLLVETKDTSSQKIEHKEIECEGELSKKIELVETDEFKDTPSAKISNMQDPKTTPENNKSEGAPSGETETLLVETDGIKDTPSEQIANIQDQETTPENNKSEGVPSRETETLLVETKETSVNLESSQGQEIESEKMEAEIVKTTEIKKISTVDAIQEKMDAEAGPCEGMETDVFDTKVIEETTPKIETKQEVEKVALADEMKDTKTDVLNEKAEVSVSETDKIITPALQLQTKAEMDTFEETKMESITPPPLDKVSKIMENAEGLSKTETEKTGDNSSIKLPLDVEKNEVVPEESISSVGASVTKTSVIDLKENTCDILDHGESEAIKPKEHESVKPTEIDISKPVDTDGSTTEKLDTSSKVPDSKEVSTPVELSAVKPVSGFKEQVSTSNEIKVAKSPEPDVSISEGLEEIKTKEGSNEPEVSRPMESDKTIPMESEISESVDEKSCSEGIEKVIEDSSETIINNEKNIENSTEKAEHITGAEQVSLKKDVDDTMEVEAQPTVIQKEEAATKLSAEKTKKASQEKGTQEEKAEAIQNKPELVTASTESSTPIKIVSQLKSSTEQPAELKTEDKIDTDSKDIPKKETSKEVLPPILKPKTGPSGICKKSTPESKDKLDEESVLGIKEETTSENNESVDKKLSEQDTTEEKTKDIKGLPIPGQVRKDVVEEDVISGKTSEVKEESISGKASDVKECSTSVEPECETKKKLSESESVIKEEDSTEISNKHVEVNKETVTEEKSDTVSNTKKIVGKTSLPETDKMETKLKPVQDQTVTKVRTRSVAEKSDVKTKCSKDDVDVVTKHTSKEHDKSNIERTETDGSPTTKSIEESAEVGSKSTTKKTKGVDVKSTAQNLAEKNKEQSMPLAEKSLVDTKLPTEKSEEIKTVVETKPSIDKNKLELNLVDEKPKKGKKRISKKLESQSTTLESETGSNSSEDKSPSEAISVSDESVSSKKKLVEPEPSITKKDSEEPTQLDCKDAVSTNTCKDSESKGELLDTKKEGLQQPAQDSEVLVVTKEVEVLQTTRSKNRDVKMLQARVRKNKELIQSKIITIEDDTEEVPNKSKEDSTEEKNLKPDKSNDDIVEKEIAEPKQDEPVIKRRRRKGKLSITAKDKLELQETVQNTKEEDSLDIKNQEETPVGTKVEEKPERDLAIIEQDSEKIEEVVKVRRGRPPKNPKLATKTKQKKKNLAEEEQVKSEETNVDLGKPNESIVETDVTPAIKPSEQIELPDTSGKRKRNLRNQRNKVSVSPAVETEPILETPVKEVTTPDKSVEIATTAPKRRRNLRNQIDTSVESPAKESEVKPEEVKDSPAEPATKRRRVLRNQAAEADTSANLETESEVTVEPIDKATEPIKRRRRNQPEASSNEAESIEIEAAEETEKAVVETPPVAKRRRNWRSQPEKPTLDTSTSETEPVKPEVDAEPIEKPAESTTGVKRRRHWRSSLPDKTAEPLTNEAESVAKPEEQVDVIQETPDKPTEPVAGKKRRGWKKELEVSNEAESASKIESEPPKTTPVKMEQSDKPAESLSGTKRRRNLRNQPDEVQIQTPETEPVADQSDTSNTKRRRLGKNQTDKPPAETTIGTRRKRSLRNQDVESSIPEGETENKNQVDDANLPQTIEIDDETPEPSISSKSPASDRNIEDELLKAAINASSVQDLEPQEAHQVPDCSEVKKAAEDVVKRESKKEEMMLIQAAHESQNREVEVPKPIAAVREEYKKPLKIVVDNVSVIKEAESTTCEDNEIVQKEFSSDEDKQAEYSSKISQDQELKLTITKTKTDEPSSILKIYDPKNPATVEVSPSESETEPEELPIPKFVIKQSSPKVMSPLKITIKPVLKPEEQHTQKGSPKLIIKPIIKPDDEIRHPEEKHHSPKITIKPIVKPSDDSDRCNSPKITIKPIIKPVEASTSPKIKFKPMVKPEEVKEEATEETENKERIVLKINKNNFPQKEVKKNDDNEKLGKIKVKFSKEGRHAHIVNEEVERPPANEAEPVKPEITTENIPTETATPVALDTEKPSQKVDVVVETPVLPVNTPVPEVTTPVPRKRGRPRKIPLVVREDFKDAKDQDPANTESPTTADESAESKSGRPKRSCRGPSVRMTLGIKPRKPRGAGRGRIGSRGGGRVEKEPKKGKISESKLKLIKEAAITARVSESLENQDVEMTTVGNPSSILINDSSEGKSKVSLLGDKAKVLGEDKSKDSSASKSKEDSNQYKSKRETGEESGAIKEEHKLESLEEASNISETVIMYEEETRMSADTNNSRAQTPAKQVLTSNVQDVVEESQSSVQSSATTESVKVKKGSRLDVFREPEGAIISADQLAEYYWGGGGPYMLQEQVAQFLGIKSFKRKYPGIQRRTVDMQERDFIRESSLASENMCDLGLTAVNSADILDIMYSDFQNKYEEYCKHLRDRQTKDITNKQKALSLAASQEKNKLDIMQQAVESAAQWNISFNKTRREERKACMDLQTFTINYPKGSVKQIPKNKIGHYPIALVPGQYTDYYRTFTPTELNNLPLNTMLYHPINVHNDDDSQSDASGSESDSSSSGSDSSDSDSSDEDCTICSPNTTPKKAVL